MRDPEISVLISVGKIDLIYFQRCLESVLSQTFQDFEVIIVDDLTTSEIRNYLVNLNDSRINIISNMTNLGLTKSLNIGLAKCSGRYIARLDADDFSDSNRFEIQHRFLTQNPDYKICGTAYNEINEAGCYIDVKVPFIYEDANIKKAMTSFNPFAHSTLMINRSDLNTVGNYCEFFKYSQDYFMSTRVLRRGKGANLDQKLVTRLVSGNQLSIKKYKQQLIYSLIIRFYACLYYPITSKTFKNIAKSLVGMMLPTKIKKLIKN